MPARRRALLVEPSAPPPNIALLASEDNLSSAFGARTHLIPTGRTPGAPLTGQVKCAAVLRRRTSLARARARLMVRTQMEITVDTAQQVGA